MTTNFQHYLYQFISEYIDEHHQSPSFADMTIAMGISPRSKSLITRSLRALSKEKKIILKKEGRRLLISLTSKQIPLVGRISAGMPIEAVSEYQLIDMNELFHGDHRFALQVKGDSMIEEGILDGDIIICQQATTAREGHIVVALIDQQNATLKRISYKKKGMVTLIPANAALKPQVYAPNRIHVQGIYVGLMRT